MGRSGKLLVLLTLIFLVAVVIVVYGRSIVAAANRQFAATPSADGEITIVASDYRFEPNVLRVRAGQQIQITLRNDGLHTHEFMVGRQVHVENGQTEPPTPDFFAGIQVEVTGGGMPMGFAGMEDMGSMDMGGDMPMEGEEHTDDEAHTDEGMDMEGEQPAQDGGHADEGMDMGEEDHAAEGDHQEGGHEEGKEHQEEGMEGMEMDMEGAKVVVPGSHAEPMEMGHMDHHGGMVMVDPGVETTITMTIPEDKVGTWAFGCFQENGLHFDDGMQGTLIVEQP